MPEPGSSPSNESPNSSEFFNAEGIVSSLQSAKKAEDETAEATQVTAKNTQGILDIIKGDIGKAVEKISSGAKVSREDAVVTENKRVRVFSQIVSTITSLDSVLKKFSGATSVFFDFLVNSVVTGIAFLGVAFLAIQLGLDKLVNQVSSFLVTAIAIPRLLLPLGGLLKATAALLAPVLGLRKLAAKAAVVAENASALSASSGKALSEIVKSSKFTERFLFRFNSVVNFFKAGGTFSKFTQPLFTFFKAFFGVFGRLASLVGKLFFPITVAVSVIQGLFDFFRGGANEGIGKLFLDIGDRLVENLTFGLLDFRSIIDKIDALVTAVRVFIAGDDEEKELLAARSLRAVDFVREGVLNDLVGLGLTSTQAQQVLATPGGVDFASLPQGTEDERRVRNLLMESGIERDLEELRERQIEASRLNPENAELRALVGELGRSIAVTNSSIDKVNQGNAASGVNGGGGGGGDVPPSRNPVTPTVTFGGGR